MVWYALTTACAKAAAAFNRSVIGWQTADAGVPDLARTLLSATTPGGPLQAGSALHCPAQDIPRVGRSAIVADPQGAWFAMVAPKR